MIDLRAVSKTYGGVPAVMPVDLHVECGRTLALLGPSGSGKSTLLRLMNGLVMPDTGSVHIDGEAFTRESAPLLRRLMGYVIQEGGLFPHLTAYDNVALLARHLRWAPERVAARITELAELTRLPEPLLARFPVELSGGQRQRVSLMRALMLDPQVLLLDEPLGALDPIIRSELQADLKAVFSSLKKTVVLVTHDLGEATFLGDDLVLLRGGQVVQRGTPEDLAMRPADPFVVQFLQAQRGMTP